MTKSTCKFCGNNFVISKEDELAVQKGVIDLPDICTDCEEDDDEFDELDLTTKNSGL